MQRKVTILAVLALMILVSGSVLAAGTPAIPKSHPDFDKDMDAKECAECHKVPEEMKANQASFCTPCHQVEPAHKTGPKPKHQVELDWESKECEECHRLHTGPNPTHQISKDTKNADLCVKCHAPGNSPSPETKTKFCARCHNLGDPTTHVELEGKTAQVCVRCHKKQGE